MTAPINPVNPPLNTGIHGDTVGNVDFMPPVPGLPGLGTTAGLPTLPRSNDPKVN